jgi:hypothetical protein
MRKPDGEPDGDRGADPDADAADASDGVVSNVMKKKKTRKVPIDAGCIDAARPSIMLPWTIA